MVKCTCPFSFSNGHGDEDFPQADVDLRLFEDVFSLRVRILCNVIHIKKFQIFFHIQCVFAVLL